MPVAVNAPAVTDSPIRRRAAIARPEVLGARLARTARALRDAWLEEFRANPDSTPLHGWHRSLAQPASPAPGAAELADVFAQTLVYGSFLARFGSNRGERVDLSTVRHYFRQGPAALRTFFDLVVGLELDRAPFAAPVNELRQTLARADLAALKKNFAARGADDFLLHFFETFLAAYAPQAREARGVYYTPAPVVGWLVRSVDAVLQSRFGFADGLADTARRAGAPRDFVICDPAAGTGAFLHAVTRHVRARHARRGGGMSWPLHLQRDVLPRLLGFELMLPPLVIAQAIFRAEFAEHGRGSEDQLRIDLANSLSDTLTPPLSPRSTVEPIAPDPFPIILGNPPYSGHSANRGEWISRLVRDYYFADGAPLRESNAKWLQDDYVKFIRWAQWRVEQSGCGIVAFVTNHRYLSNVTFPGLRQQLLQTFDEILVLDLHGSKKPLETCPDGSVDENVFAIQQGVALGIFVKRPRAAGEKKPNACVHHADLYGTRAEKHRWLDAHDVATTPWTTVTPRSPDYLFVPQDAARLEEYARGWKVTDLMPEHSLGILTKRDGLVVDFDRASLIERLEDFCNERASDDEIGRRFKLLTRDHDSWDLAAARSAIRAKRPQLDYRNIAYRPFDARVVAYEPELVARMNQRVLGHLTGDNSALVIGRQGQATGSKQWDVVFATDTLVDQNIFARGGGTVFPLYLHSGSGPTPNLAPQFIAECAARLALNFAPHAGAARSRAFSPPDVVHYIYALLHAPDYRTRYAEFIRCDFPRVPLTANRDLFWRLCDLGQQLLELHRLRSTGDLRVTFPANGDNRVDEVTYIPADGQEPAKVRINARQWFENVPAAAWSFHIGGFQVAEKWLKDRRGRVLTGEACRIYSRIISALAETVRVQSQIDTAIAAAGGWPVK